MQCCSFFFKKKSCKIVAQMSKTSADAAVTGLGCWGSKNAPRVGSDNAGIGWTAVELMWSAPGPFICFLWHNNSTRDPHIFMDVNPLTY